MGVEATDGAGFIGHRATGEARSWLLVTPARNEASRLPALAKSLREQEVSPIGLWIIVDDGSTDGTATAVRQEDVPFPLLVVRKQNDGGLRGGSAFTSFFYGAEAGLRHLPDAKRILKLDADVVLARGYFKALAVVPEEVALIGGVAAGWRDREQTDLVPGFLKAYNREAFEIVRKLPRAIGLDMVDESALRHQGLEVRVVREAHARVRQIGESEGIIRGRWRNGIVSRWTGYHPLYFVLRVLRYAVRRPVGIGAIALVWGYATSGSGPFPKELQAEMRERQRAKLRRLVKQPLFFLRESYDVKSCDDPECCAPRGPIRVEAAFGEGLDEVVRLCGVALHALDFESAADRIVELSRSGQPALVVTTNVDHVVLLQADDDFRLAYERATLRVADGVPLVVLSRLVGRPLPGRVNGTNLIPAVCERAAHLGVRAAFVGGEPGVAEKAAERLAERFPGLKVVACLSPEFGFDQDQVRSSDLAQTVCSSGAEIVFLGLGAPRQEIWASRWLPELGGATVVCIGGALDYLAGTKRRAPVFMQRWGLEWLFRLLGEPRRLWRRYLVQDSAFFGLALRELRTRGKR
jgi:exopolysaccharide biosynthesis WecB/TagA/CpsF family protein